LIVRIVFAKPDTVTINTDLILSTIEKEGIFLKEIKITDIEGIKIGNAQDAGGGTGCTVLIAPNGAPAGVDVRGGGPASRESQLLNPVMSMTKIHAVLLSGGSAFGLDAAGGVMRFLEEKDIGFDVGVTKVPLVCASCLFDLVVGDFRCRPDADMAYKACMDAFENNSPEQGCVGAGTGATVGKVNGAESALKSGLGIYAEEVNGLKVGAVAAVNAFGDIFENGKQISGAVNADKTAFLSTEEEMYKTVVPVSVEDRFSAGTNTTICCVVTNARFNKAEMNKIAAMAQDGMSRAIRPVHTAMDGDTVYAMSTGSFAADLNVVGTLAARVLEKAIANAAKNAETMYGFTAAKDLDF